MQIEYVEFVYNGVDLCVYVVSECYMWTDWEAR